MTLSFGTPTLDLCVSQTITLASDELTGGDRFDPRKNASMPPIYRLKPKAGVWHECGRKSTFRRRG
jgi:hypothetical protein